VARHWRPRGRASLVRLHPTSARRARAVSDRAGPLRDVSRRRGPRPRRRRAAAIHRRGVSRVPALRRPRGWVCAISLCRLWAGSPGAVLLQGPRGVSELRRSAYGRARRARGGSRLPRRPGAAMGVEPPAPAPLRARLGPRALPRGHGRFRARRARISPATRASRAHRMAAAARWPSSSASAPR
jgi:hypothetical protein